LSFEWLCRAAAKISVRGVLLRKWSTYSEYSFADNPLNPLNLFVET